MKVLHVAQMAKGGPASYLSEIVPYQRAALGEANVRVVVPQDQVRYLDLSSTDGDRTIASVAANSRRSAWNLLRFLVLTMTVIRAERPDILHLHSTYAGALIRLWYLFGFARRPKIVYCSHGWAFNMRVSERKRRLYAWFERRMMRVTDIVICISRFEYDQAVLRGIPAETMVVIVNGIEDRPAIQDKLREIYNPATLNLLFIGRHDPQKGLDILIASMRLVKDRKITLHVVGEAVVSSENAMDPLQNVVFHGWQSRSRVDHLMAGADVLVMPSRWEGFGLTAIEAMRQGTPVCASNVDALPEIVHQDISGYLFPPENPDVLAELLKSLDRESLEKMSRSTRKWFEDNFDAKRLNEAILRCYRSLFAA